MIIQNYKSDSTSPLRDSTSTNYTQLEGDENRITKVSLSQFQRSKENCSLRKGLEVSAKVSAIIMSLWGCLYFIPVNNQAAGENPYLGVVLNIANAASVTALNSWAFLKMINNLRDEKRASSNQGKCFPLSVAAGTVIGLLSQGAIAYVAYISNEEKILPAVVIFLADGPPPIYSTILSLQRCCIPPKTEQEKYFDQVKVELKKLLQQSRESFLSLNRDGQKAFGEDLLSKISDENPTPFFEKLFSGNLSNSTSSSCDRGIQKAITAFSLFFVVCQRAVASRIGYLAGERFSDGNVIAGVLSGGVVGAASFYVSKTSAVKTSLSLYRRGRDHFLRKYIAPISEQLRPRLSQALDITRIGIAGLCWGASKSVAEDAFPEGALQDVMKTILPLTWSLVTLNAMKDLCNDFIRDRLSNSSDNEEFAIYAVDRFYQTHQEELDKCSYKHMAEYIKNLPNSVLEKIKHPQAKEFATTFLRLDEDLETVV